MLPLHTAELALVVGLLLHAVELTLIVDVHLVEQVELLLLVLLELILLVDAILGEVLASHIAALVVDSPSSEPAALPCLYLPMAVPGGM